MKHNNSTIYSTSKYNNKIISLVADIPPNKLPYVVVLIWRHSIGAKIFIKFDFRNSFIYIGNPLTHDNNPRHHFPLSQQINCVTVEDCSMTTSLTSLFTITVNDKKFGVIQVWPINSPALVVVYIFYKYI